ncbi:ATP-binding protein [Halomonas mongoliensis]|uniref:ATP-binding protein n=1 Tax=Halomonas mongoliensis TaxID=321265 RepID=UPI00403AD71C
MTATGKKRLPIGIQTFSEIIEGGYYYVDKTPVIERLVQQNKYYFLSRPRRFGKSLLLDTLHCLFEGRQALFEGLYIYDRWDWGQANPVIHLSLSSGRPNSTEELDVLLHEQLRRNYRRLGIDMPADIHDAAFLLNILVRETYHATGQQVIVLIDEYDQPVQNVLGHRSLAFPMWRQLLAFYSALKEADPYLHFVMLTGVGRYATAEALGGGLDMLMDISFSPEYADICGFTDTEITSFLPELEAHQYEALRQWFGGHRFSFHGPDLYNPDDIFGWAQAQKIAPYWFEANFSSYLNVEAIESSKPKDPRFQVWAVPRSLWQLVMHNGAAILSGQVRAPNTMFKRHDTLTYGSLSPLLEAGWLTLVNEETSPFHLNVWTLGIPNLAVGSSLSGILLDVLLADKYASIDFRRKLAEILKTNDLAGLEAHLKALYAGLPHDWYRNNPIAKYEGHYASVFYSHFAALGVNVTVEDASHHGRVDMAVDACGHLYLFEFKVVEQLPEGKALEQIQARGYADKYRAAGKPIHLIGVEFSREQRQIVAFDIETESPP